MHPVAVVKAQVSESRAAFELGMDFPLLEQIIPAGFLSSPKQQVIGLPEFVEGDRRPGMMLHVIWHAPCQPSKKPVRIVGTRVLVDSSGKFASTMLSEQVEPQNGLCKKSRANPEVPKRPSHPRTHGARKGQETVSQEVSPCFAFHFIAGPLIPQVCFVAAADGMAQEGEGGIQPKGYT